METVNSILRISGTVTVLYNLAEQTEDECDRWRVDHVSLCIFNSCTFIAATRTRLVGSAQPAEP